MESIDSIRNEYLARQYVKMGTCVKCGHYISRRACTHCGQESSVEANLQVIEKDSSIT